MQIDLVLLVVAATGVMIAGVSKGGFGGSASFVAAPIMTLVMDPGIALAVMLPLLLVMDAANLRAYWGQWSKVCVRRLVIGGVPGVCVAALVYRFANPDFFRLLIGVISLAFVLFRLGLSRGWWVPSSRPLGARAGVTSGVAAGFTSFVAHAGGPAALIYLLSQGLTKLQFQATTVALFAALNVLKLSFYTGLGLFTPDTLKLVVILSPIAVVGSVVGVRANRIISEAAFFGATYVLLTLAGGKLIWDALM